MRILHITEAISAGVLTSVTALARAQSAHPDVRSVTLACVARGDSPPPAAIAEMCGHDVAMRVLPCRQRRRLIDLTRLIRTEIRRDTEAVVHLHSSRAGFIGRVLTALQGTAHRVVYSPHCFSFDRADLPAAARVAFRVLERAALRAGRNLVLVSHSEAALTARVLPGAAVATVPNTVDVAACRSAATRAGKPAGPVRIIHIGRIAGQKRPEVFAAVADAVAEARPGQAEFQWIGEGERGRLSSNVSVTGWLTPSHVREHVAAADMVLFTSAGEGMPMSLLEAQACGLPVIAHDVTGVRDIVRDGETGLLANSSQDLIAAVLQLLDDPPAATELGRAAAAHIAAHHDTSRLAETSLAAYRQLLPAAVTAHHRDEEMTLS